MSSADAYASLSGQSQRNSYYAHGRQPSAGAVSAAASAPRPTSAAANAWGPDADDSDDEEEDWNIYDDFNNVRPLSRAPEAAGLSSAEYARRASQDVRRSFGAGMRHQTSSSIGSPVYEDEKRQSLLPSSAFGFDVRNGDPRLAHAKRGSYMDDKSALYTPTREERSAFADPANGAASHSGIELVTVPALGQEFTEDERRKMTRPYKRKTKRGAKKQKFMAWTKGEDKVFGFLDPRMLVFIVFFLCIFLGVALYFVIPRVPTFAFLESKPFDAVPDGSGMSIGYSPAANFSMEMKANLRADNQGGWIPSTLTDVTVKVTDVDTYIMVGQGSIPSISFAGRKKTEFQFPVFFSYKSLNQTGDATWQAFHSACGPVYPNSPRPYLNLELVLEFNVRGLIGRKGASTALNDIVCPFYLQPTQ